LADANGSSPAIAPIPAPAAVAPPGPRKAPAFTPKKAFQATNSMERLKEYLKEVPVLHKRLTDVVVGLEANLSSARASLAQFDETTSRVRALVDRMEKEERDQHVAEPAHPGTGGAAGDAPTAYGPVASA